ncbi:hypothetical protein MYX82_07775 [Acidobacteria bacterium AH-259-D05]|nr:hypothetical protein [Acidobacteria bacterium AH-259-D05]
MTLGSGSGHPNAEVNIPLYLMLAKNQRVVRVLATFEYPTGSFDFNKIEHSGFAKRNSVSIEITEFQDETENLTNSLKIEIEAPEGGSLPSGMIGLLFFRIFEHAQPGIISLPVVNIQASGINDSSVAQPVGNEGTIIIYEPGSEPVFACLFYMH